MQDKQIREELYNKLEKEFNDYKEKLKTLPPNEILDNAYQYVMKEELYAMFYPEYERYEIEEIKALNKTKNPLEELYQGWMDCDYGIHTTLEDSIDTTLDNVVKEQKAKNKTRER